MRELKFSRDTFDYENNFKVEGVSGDVSLRKGYNTEDDGIIYGLQGGVMIKSHYSEQDKKHRERMNNYVPIKNGEEVLIEGKVYKANIKGNYSDCVIFEPKA